MSPISEADKSSEDESILKEEKTNMSNNIKCFKYAGQVAAQTVKKCSDFVTVIQLF